MEPGQVHGGAQFERSGLLALHNRQRRFEQFLPVGRPTGSAFDDKGARLQAQEFRFSPVAVRPGEGLLTEPTAATQP